MIKRILGRKGKKYVYLKLDLKFEDFPVEVQEDAKMYAKMRGYGGYVGGRRYWDVLHEYLQDWAQATIERRLKEMKEDVALFGGGAGRQDETASGG